MSGIGRTNAKFATNAQTVSPLIVSLKQPYGVGRPLDFIRATNPLSTEKTYGDRSTKGSDQPQSAFRYSATHKNFTGRRLAAVKERCTAFVNARIAWRVCAGWAKAELLY